ncbi:GRB2-associated-binding protein 2 [Cricetulus griseus]|nr:GRB2-associated-binding protein 2 [Cricetulus griseus]
MLECWLARSSEFLVQATTDTSASNDVVCRGWLEKLPPEKKLGHYAWKKRWFILRRGQMSGDPDVLEYYKNEHSKKPLQDIKTNELTFYLVAETKADMNRWVQSICQICGFSQTKVSTDALRNLSSVSHHLLSSPAEFSSSSHHLLQQLKHGHSEKTLVFLLLLITCDSESKGAFYSPSCQRSKKLNKEITELKDVMTQMELTNIYRMFHQNTKEYTFFSAPHESSPKLTIYLVTKQFEFSLVKSAEVGFKYAQDVRECSIIHGNMNNLSDIYISFRQQFFYTYEYVYTYE